MNCFGRSRVQLMWFFLPWKVLKIVALPHLRELICTRTSNNDASKYRARNRGVATGAKGPRGSACAARPAAGSAHQGDCGSESCHPSTSARGNRRGEWAPVRSVKMKRKCFRALAGKISSHLAKKQAPIDLTGASPIAGWRCDLCAEVVVTHDRPLVPPERCFRCNSSNMTSMEEGGARRPPLGLWTR